jgi:hypothetical protein
MSILGHLEIKTSSRRVIVFKEKQNIYVYFVFSTKSYITLCEKQFMKGLENVIIPTFT